MAPSFIQLFQASNLTGILDSSIKPTVKPSANLLALLSNYVSDHFSSSLSNEVLISVTDFFCKYIAMGVGWREGLLMFLAYPRYGNNIVAKNQRTKTYQK